MTRVSATQGAAGAMAAVGLRLARPLSHDVLSFFQNGLVEVGRGIWLDLGGLGGTSTWMQVS